MITRMHCRHVDYELTAEDLELNEICIPPYYRCYLSSYSRTTTPIKCYRTTRVLSIIS